ncbi:MULTISPECIES: helix-hairpin-helix domain-containing protein [Trueperella]|uniref:helix-hairpin-helix domain-containing protein n=1 Tax=Trueperella TaxID=1069494 RepID=UPI001AEF8659|nr:MULTISPECIES: helix-hairpin-helix domain-containing protein [Trueperella]
MTTMPTRRPASRQSTADWEKVEGFTRTAMRLGAGDDVGALTTPAMKRRFVLDGNSLRIAAVLLLVLALSGVIGALSGRSTEVAVIPQGEESAQSKAGAGDGGAGSGESTEGGHAVDGTASGKAAPDSAGSEEASARAETIVVHVSGQVAVPGVVTLPAPARVADAVQAAGGPTGEADLARINLAGPISDGVHIHVPAVGEGGDATGSGVVGGEGAASGGAGDTGAADGKVNLNTADQAGLEAIPGVGPVTAKAIIDWRNANGTFTSIDQLIDVRGIGPKTLEQLRDHVRI